MAWLTALLIYRDSLQNLPCIWTTVVACVLKRHQITCIWGNYSVFFSGQSQSRVEEFVPNRNYSGTCTSEGCSVGSSETFFFQSWKSDYSCFLKDPKKTTVRCLRTKEKILLLKSRVIFSLMLESWACASKSFANGLRSWPLHRTVWSFSCLPVSDENSSSIQEIDSRGGE